jgi:hypothetical protein
MALAIVPLASAKSPKGPSGPAGKSNVGHLYLYEKTEPAQPYPPGTPWTINEDGAWGKMKYRLSGSLFEFVFNGHKLTPKEQYTLVYYPDPWPGTGLICLGSGTANRGGNVHIATSTDIDTSLPIPADLNNPENPGHGACVLGSTCIEGAKIWLVLSSDVDCNNRSMVGWNAEEYLFEDIGIFFNYTGSVNPQ